MSAQRYLSLRCIVTQNARRLSLEELEPIVAFYQSKLSGWRVVRQSVLVREAAPIAQGIAFERLPDGAYRLVGHLRVLVAPEPVWALEMPQYLDIKVRQIGRLEHPELRDRACEAMCTEFVPAVRSPLRSDDALKLYEQAALPTAAEAYSLAAFNAYLGNNDQARTWCRRYTELSTRLDFQSQEAGDFRQAFLDQLELWLSKGEAPQQLERVLQEERRKWDLA